MPQLRNCRDRVRRRIRRKQADVAGGLACAAEADGALARAPEQAVAFVKARLRPLPFPEHDAIQKQIARLDSDQFAEREQAQEELLRSGQNAETLLEDFLGGQPALEARRRAQEILDGLMEATTAFHEHGRPPDDLTLMLVRRQ